MFGGVPREVLLEQNEGLETLLFFKVPWGVLLGPFWGPKVKKNEENQLYVLSFFENIMKTLASTSASK